MRQSTAAVLLALAAGWLGAPAPAGAEGLKVVVFDIEPQGLPKTRQVGDKLKAETDLLRKMVTERGYTLVDTAPQAQKIADSSPLGECNGCDQDIAKALGADLEVATSMQQISAAIFNLGGAVKDVKTNRVLRQGVVDIRGDDTDNWNHGVKFLVKERLFDPPLPKTAGELATVVQAAGKGGD